MAEKMHFPEDVHEKYLLGELTDKERQAYEDHLKDSPERRRELEAEKLLISSIRAAGRADMKDEIRRQATQFKSRSASDMRDWTMIMKVAAVLCIAVIAPYMYYLSQDQFEMQNASVAEAPTPAMEKEAEFKAEGDLMAGGLADAAPPSRQQPAASKPAIERELNEAVAGRASSAEKRIRSNARTRPGEDRAENLAAAPPVDAAEPRPLRGKTDAIDKDLAKPAKDGLLAVEESAEEIAVLGEAASDDVSDLPYQATGLRKAGPSADPILGKAKKKKQELALESQIASSAAEDSEVSAGSGWAASNLDLNDEKTRVTEGVSYFYSNEQPPASSRRRDYSLQQNQIKSYDERSREIAGTLRHVFQAGAAVIGITFEVAAGASKSYSRSRKLFNFPLQILAFTTLRDSTRREMRLVVPEEFMKLNPQNMVVTLRGANDLELRINEEVVYDVNVESDSSRAILRKRE